jgi:tRNA pseudouridine55 synthase
MNLPDNILLIDKPSGMTSHDVVNIIRRQKDMQRIGHAGTLDPLATGLLIILVGREATRQQDSFMKQDKEYECTARFGITTDTYDMGGKVLTEFDPTNLTQEKIENVLPKFRGSIEQTAPAYSAIKIAGERLYDKARKGTIAQDDLPRRQVIIHQLILKSFTQSAEKVEATFTIACSSGTYIRSLIYDIGQELGVGATVTQLRRTKIGNYSVNDAQPIENKPRSK